MEPRAYAVDFKNMQRKIYDILPDNTSMELSFSDEKEFIRFNLYRHIKSIINEYEKYTKDLDFKASLPVEKVINKYGANVYGFNPYKGYLKTEKSFAFKVIREFFFKQC
jgi:hypothetical protein